MHGVTDRKSRSHAADRSDKVVAQDVKLSSVSPLPVQDSFEKMVSFEIAKDGQF